MDLSSEQYGFAGELSQELYEDLTNGVHSVLYKRISCLSVNNPIIKEAYNGFKEAAEVGDDFSVYDLIFGVESVIKKYEPKADSESDIYCLEGLTNDKSMKKLLKYSVGNIYALLGMRNGISLDIDSVGGSVSAGELKRFAVVSPRRAASIMPMAQYFGVKVTKVGRMLASESLLLTQGNAVIASVSKNYVYPSERYNISLDDENLADYLNGYYAACTFASCMSVAPDNAIRFGLGGDIAAVFARALGYFTAMRYLKAIPANIVFTNNENCDVAVPRPNISDGDYLFLLKLREDAFGLPDKTHQSQLNYYLAEMKRRGVIKNVLPVKENVESTVISLCPEGQEYVPINEIPNDCFGVIAITGRGQSLNGIQMGYFRSI